MGVWEWIKEQTVVGDVVDWFDEQGLSDAVRFLTVFDTLDVMADWLTPTLPELPSVGAVSANYSQDQPANTINEGVNIAWAVGHVRVAGNIIRANDPAGDTVSRLIVGHCIGPCDYALAIYINGLGYKDNLYGTQAQTQLGTQAQSPVQVGGEDLFTNQACAYRGLCHTGLILSKTNQELAGPQSVWLDLRAALLEPIGGGDWVFTRNPAVVLWHWYRHIEGYAAADLDEDAFASLEAFCGAYPATGDGAPMRPSLGQHNTIIVEAGSYLDTDHWPDHAVDYESPIDGPWSNGGWVTSETSNQSFKLDLGRKVLATAIQIVNGHNDGADLTAGINSFDLQGSNNANASSYYSSDYFWTTIAAGLTAAQYDATDPVETITLASPGTDAFRWFRLKIHSNHGHANRMAIRDLVIMARNPRRAFDFVADTTISANDYKKMLWRAFNGRVIHSQGKLKPVWDWNQEADGAGGLTAKTSRFAFDEDNIVAGTLEWWRPDRPNVFTIHYIEPGENWSKRSVTVRDEPDIADRGEVPFEEECWYLTGRDLARRRADRMLKKARYVDYLVRLKALSVAQAVELFDVVTVTHDDPGFSGKLFVVTDKREDLLGRCGFTLEAYSAALHTDDQVPMEAGYQPVLPNPFTRPHHVTDLAVTDGSYFTLGGHYVIQLDVTYDLPANAAHWNHARIQWAIGNDGSGNLSTSGTSTTVTLPAADYPVIKVGHVLYANGEARAVVSRDGSNQVTVARPVDWSAGHTFQWMEFFDYSAADNTRGAGFTVFGNALGARLGDTVYLRAISINSQGVEADEDLAPIEAVTIALDLETAITGLPSNVTQITVPEGDFTLSAGGFDFPASRTLEIIGESLDGTVIKNNPGDNGFQFTDLTGNVTFKNLTFESQNTAAFSNMIHAVKSAGFTGNVLIDAVVFNLADNDAQGYTSAGDTGVYANNWTGRVEVRGCRFNGGKYGTRCISSEANAELILMGNQARESTYVGLYGGANRLTVSLNQMFDMAYSGLYLSISGGLKIVSANLVEAASDAASFAGCRIYGSLTANPQFIFANNTVRVASTDPDGSFTGVSMEQVRGAQFTDNIVDIDVTTSGPVGGVAVAACKKCKFADNISIDNDGTGNNYGYIFSNVMSY